MARAGRWTRGECVELLQSWAALHGRPSWSDWSPRAPEGMPSLGTLGKLFGGWRAALVAAGLEEPRPEGFRWQHRTVAQEFRVVDLSSCHSQAEIAAITGLGKTVVVDVQRKYHVVLRFGRSYSSAHFRYRFDEHAWGRVFEHLYHEQRLPLDVVAQRMGLHPSTVRRRAVRLGFRIRKTGEANRGRKRGRYDYRPDLPTCRTEGCETKVASYGTVLTDDGEPDGPYCATCRRQPNRIRFGVDERGWVRFPADHPGARVRSRQPEREEPARER